MLTDAFVRNQPPPGRHYDGRGLYLQVTPAGARYWRMKYRHQGKEKLLALGVYPAVSLKQARIAVAAARERLDVGADPSAERKAAKQAAALERGNTLRAVTDEWLAHQAARWTATTTRRMRRALELHVFPELGERPLAGIRPDELRAVIVATEGKGIGETAARVLQWVKAVYRWAVAHGRIDDNPMRDLYAGELLAPRDKRNRLMLPEDELPVFLERLDHYDGDLATTSAMRVLVLTAARPGEVRGARWREVDLDAGRWTIPAARMKMRAEHRVPLSHQAVEALRRMWQLSGQGELVFPSPHYPGKPISDGTLNSCLVRLGFKGLATAHGFRALFSSTANEAGWDADVIERQLAHKEPNAIRAAYHRATYMQERTRLMQWWADELDKRRQA